ncbi:TPA: antiterminator, partial [Escherichia coli]|nr:antiterminator [Escherichia coli]
LFVMRTRSKQKAAFSKQSVAKVD